MTSTISVFVAFFVVSQLSTQSQICSLKQEDEHCEQRSDCCSMCCRSGKCVNSGNCFSTCPSTADSIKEISDICNITILLAEFMDTSENLADAFLYQIEEVRTKIVPIFLELPKNPVDAVFKFPTLVNEFEQIIKSILSSSEHSIRKAFSILINIGRFVTKLFYDFYSAIINEK